MVVEKGELPTKTSYSALSSWLHCQKQYELEKVQRVRRRPAWYFVGGTVFHEWSEILDRGFEVPNIKTMFMDAVAKEEETSGVKREDWSAGGRISKEYPGKESEKWWLDNLPLMAEKYVAWREKTGWEIWTAPDGKLAVELDLEFPLGDETIRAHVDRVFVLPGNKNLLVPLDIKAGSRTPDNSVQLGVYRVGLNAKYGFLSKYGYYYMARKGEHTKPLDLTVWSPALLQEVYRQFTYGIKGGVFVPNPGGHCNTCSVARFCAVGGGADADQHDPLSELAEIPF